MWLYVVITKESLTGKIGGKTFFKLNLKVWFVNLY